MMRPKKNAMLSRNRGVRRRIYFIFGGIVAAFVFVFAVIAVFPHRPRPGSAVANAETPGTASASGAQPAPSPRPHFSPEGAPAADGKPCRELQELIERLVKKELPRAAIVMFENNAIATEAAKVELQVARTRRELTDVEKALDPGAHSVKELSETLLSLVADLDVLPALEAEAAARNGDFSRGVYQMPISRLYGIAWRQVAGAADKGTPEQALDRWIRMARLPGYRQPEGVNLLWHVVDRFPGAVPENLAKDVVACFRETPDVEALQRYATERCDLYDHVYEVTSTETLGGGDARDDSVMGAVYSFVRLDKDNYFRKRMRLAANKGMDSFRATLAANIARPPYLAGKDMGTQIWLTPRHSINVYRVWTEIWPHVCQVWDTAYYCDATRTALALKAYRSAHGAYPETLWDLVPEQMSVVPVTPITGDLPGYKRTADGFELERPKYPFLPDGHSSMMLSSLVWRARN